MTLMAFLCALLLAYLSKRFWVGVPGGPLGIFLFGMLVTQFQLLDWLVLNASPADAGLRFVGRFWAIGAGAGIAGAALGWLARRMKAARRLRAAEQVGMPSSEGLQKSDEETRG